MTTCATISVIVPAYNRADLIGATLDSILAQETRATEIIVVDDGSTDGTQAVLEAYLARIRVIRVVNGGDLAARNVGLRAAASPLVAFCDSDDLWRPTFLTAMVQLWRMAPDLVAAYGNFSIVRDGAWEERTKFDDAPPSFWQGLQVLAPGIGLFETAIPERLLAFQPFFPSAMAVRRTAFLEAGGWDETVSRIVGTDLATVLRAAEQPLGIVRQPLVGIRRHGGNFSGDVQAMNLGDALILEQLLTRRPALTAHRAAVLASIADRRAAAADTAFDRRDYEAVRRIQEMLPSSHRPLRRQIKGWISHLPGPAAHIAASLSARLVR